MKLDRIYKSLVVLALVITGLILTKDIVMPIAFAALFAMVLLPLVRRLEKRTGRVISIILILLFAFLAMTLISWFVIAQVTTLAESLPDFISEHDTARHGIVLTALRDIKQWMEKELSDELDADDKLRRLYIMVDLGITSMVGMFADRNFATGMM